LFEPKWDGFRAIVFRGESDVFIQSRDLRPLDRYFPELHGRCCKDFRRAALSMARS
jgi:ATP-dependent DNA ligase